MIDSLSLLVLAALGVATKGSPPITRLGHNDLQSHVASRSGTNNECPPGALPEGNKEAYIPAGQQTTILDLSGGTIYGPKCRDPCKVVVAVEDDFPPTVTMIGEYPNNKAQITRNCVYNGCRSVADVYITWWCNPV